MRTLAALLSALLLVAMAGCAIQQPPGEPSDSARALRATLERADLAMREARLVDAEILYRELAGSHPRLPDVWLQLGNLYARQSQLEAAARTYKQGLGFNPDDGRLWHNLALIELRQSIATLETASELLAPTNPQRSRIQELHRALLLAGQPASAAER